MKKEKFLIQQAAIDRMIELQKMGFYAWWYKDHIGIFVCWKVNK